jgi:acetylornithine deacetylase/succinyl-diaminopimelate desuccinylase-like protein
MRLVPNQDPHDVGKQLKQYMLDRAPNTVRWEDVDMQGGPASISDRNSAPIQALSQAMETVWGQRPVFRREGGSVPVVAQFQQYLKIESVNTGFGLPTDNMHSPNEKLHLPTTYKGIDTIIHFFYNVATIS